MLTFLTSLYYITQVDYCLQYENSHILDACSQWLLLGFFVQKVFEVATGKKHDKTKARLLSLFKKIRKRQWLYLF